MKRAIIIICLLHVALLGALVWDHHQQARERSLADRAGALAGQAKAKVAGVKEAVVEQSRGFGDEIGDARIISTLKAKYFMERDLSALAITIECTDGRVVLTGSAASPELVTRAVELSRQTSGVRTVTSKLKVKN